MGFVALLIFHFHVIKLSTNACRVYWLWRSTYGSPSIISWHPLKLLAENFVSRITESFYLQQSSCTSGIARACNCLWGSWSFWFRNN